MVPSCYKSSNNSCKSTIDSSCERKICGSDKVIHVDVSLTKPIVRDSPYTESTRFNTDEVCESVRKWGDNACRWSTRSKRIKCRSTWKWNGRVKASECLWSIPYESAIRRSSEGGDVPKTWYTANVFVVLTSMYCQFFWSIEYYFQNMESYPKRINKFETWFSKSTNKSKSRMSNNTYIT